MGKSGKRLGEAIGLALLALAAWSPIARGDETEASGRGAWLGVSTRNLSEAWRERNDYWSGGVMVVKVAPGGPADQAGIGPGDVLVSVDARSLREPADLSEAESGMDPGRPVAVVLARNGGRSIKIFNVEPGRSGESGREDTERPAREEVPVPPVPGQEPRGAADDAVTESPPPATGAGRDVTTELGVRCQNLSTDLAEALGAPEAHGVLVLDVRDGGAAQRAGIRSGDVIFKVGDQPVEDLSGLDQAIAAAPSRAPIAMLRRGIPQQAIVELVGHAAAGSRAAPAEPGGGTGDAWRDRMLLELRDEVRELRKEVQALRDRLARRTRD